MNRQVALSILIFICLIVATLLVVAYGKGYRPDFGQGKVEFNGTGLLVSTSVPDGASVFVNGKLKTATDNTINLSPGNYKIRIEKEGYFPWEKNVIITESVVSRADALLIPTAPKLENITTTGASEPVIDPTLTKIAFVVASQSSVVNGIYVYNMANTPLLTIQSASTQVVDESANLFSKSKIGWSPDGKDIMATISGQATPVTYLLNTDQPNNPPNNITSTIASTEEVWNTIRLAKERAALNSLPSKARVLVKQNFNVRLIHRTRIKFSTRQAAPQLFL